MRTTGKETWTARLRRKWAWRSDVSLDEAKLKQLLGRAENESVEFKEKLLSYDKIAEYAVGIGNAGGGLLVMGVTDRRPRQVRGIPELTEDELERMSMSLHNSCGIRVRVLPSKLQDGTYLLGVAIPPRPRGHVLCTQNGKYLIRVGGNLVGMPEAEVARILGERRFLHQVLGVLSALSIVALIGLAVVRRSEKRARPLTDQDFVVLGDISAPNSELGLAKTIRQAVEVKLQESNFLSVIPDERIQQQLSRMVKPTATSLTGKIATEICGREGGKAVITGSIATTGGVYVIGLNAFDCQSSRSLAHAQAEAETKEQTTEAAARAAVDLRRGLGEALATPRFDVPIQDATTSSYVAFSYYAAGNEKISLGLDSEAIGYFKRAVEEDPHFALAYAKLAASYDNLDESDEAEKYAQKAFDLRGNTTESERFYITAYYHDLVTGDVPAEIETYEAWKVAYPRAWMPRWLLADAYITYIGDFEKAVEEAHAAVRLNPKDHDMYLRLAIALSGVGRFDDAKAVLTQAITLRPDSSTSHAELYEIAFAQGDQATMQEEANWLQEHSDEYEAVLAKAEIARFSGRLGVARQKFHEAAVLRLKQGFREAAANTATEAALLDAFVGNYREAHTEASAQVAAARKANVLIYGMLAFSLSGATDRAQGLIEKLRARYPRDTNVNAIFIPMALAAMHIGSGQPQKAIDALDVTVHHELAESADFFPMYLRGQAYLGMRSGVQAAAEFQKILDHRGVDLTSVLYPLAHLGLARAYALQGDSAKARAAYNDFFTLWKDADSNIPILKQAKAEDEKLQSQVSQR